MMALMQRYTTELSTHTGTSYRIENDENQSIEKVLNEISTIKQHDEDEKRYLHSLNDRLEELLRNLNELELANNHLREELNRLITSWGIHSENRIQFLKELDSIINQLTEQNRQKVLSQAQTKIFDERIQFTDRILNVFIDVINLYRDKSQISSDLINELEEELRKIRLRLEISNNQVKSHDDDYQKELGKFRSYLSEWSQLALDKQHLLNDIQSLKEHYNLRLAYNQEEIHEWQRLLNRISQESKNYYRDYLDTIKQQIQMDYEQMAKDQQLDIEIQFKSRLKQIQQRIESGLPIDEHDERKRREEKEKFDNRLEQNTKEYDHLQNDYRNIVDEIENKRKFLRDLENELRNKKRKNAEQHAILEYNTDLTKNQYLTLRDELDKLAYQLRFSVEEELKIYEALLNSFQKKNQHLPIDHSKTRQITTKKYTDTISSSAKSTGFPRIPIDSTEITRKYTDTTNIASTPTGFARIPIDSTEITRKYTDTTNIASTPTGFPRIPIDSTEITRKYTDTTDIASTPTAFPRITIDATEITRKYTDITNRASTSTAFPRIPIDSTEITRKYTDTTNIASTPTDFPHIPIDATEITRKYTSQTNYDDLFKYRPPAFLAETKTTTTKTTTAASKQKDDTPKTSIRIEPPENVNNQWTYETVTSGTTSSTHDEGTDRDRSVERPIIPTRPDLDRLAGGIQQNLLDQNRTTTTTTKTTRRFGHMNTGQQQQQQKDSSTTRKEQTAITSTIPEVDEKFLQSKIHITRKYKGNILIKFVDVNGRFVEIENTGNTSRDLTGWYIERTIDGQKIDYTFPIYELPAHTTVKIYGNYHRRSSTSADDHLELIAPNFYDWGNGKFMRTELFNRDDVGKALFEQTIRD